MPQYMCLIYDDETRWQRMTDEERNAMMQEYFAFTDELVAAGAQVHSAPLQPTTVARTVRVRDREQQVTDGPFAETKEQLGGYYLVDADSIEEAVSWAAKIPTARHGSIEVREVMQIPAREGAAS